MLCCVMGFHDSGVFMLSSQNSPPLPSPNIAMYALATLHKKSSFSIPFIHFIAALVFSSCNAAFGHPYLVDSRSSSCHRYRKLSTKNPPVPQAGSINNSFGLGAISSTSSFTTFRGVKNCPCPPFSAS